jgi:hypothetical protein
MNVFGTVALYRHLCGQRPISKVDKWSHRGYSRLTAAELVMSRPGGLYRAKIVKSRGKESGRFQSGSTSMLITDADAGGDARNDVEACEAQVLLHILYLPSSVVCTV